MRKRALLLLVPAVAVLASGCSKKDQHSDEVRKAVEATTPHSFRLDYTVEAAGGTLNVKGIVEDDFRYKLQLALDDEPAAEQVVVDDGVALRFFDENLVGSFTDPAMEGQVETDTDVEGATVFDALEAGRWVLDPAGAPSSVLTTLDTDDEEAARDPMFDARTALEYVRRISETTPFIRYDPESLDPTYREDEDPFPVPSEESGVIRYDAVIEDLPAAAAATSGARALPTTRNFRKMAVYVKDGTVIAAREMIGVSPRQLQDLLAYEEVLVEATAGEEVLASFKAETERLADDPEALTEFLLGGLNTFVTSTGAQPIRFRTMSLQISDLDAVSTRVELPTDVIKGDLAVIRNLGRKPLVDETSSAPDA